MNYRTENKGISTIQKSPLRGDLEGQFAQQRSSSQRQTAYC